MEKTTLTSTELASLVHSGEWGFIAFTLDPQSLEEVAIYSDRRGDGVPREVWVASIPTHAGEFTFGYAGRA